MNEAKSEIQRIVMEASKEIRLSCDEYHQHNYRKCFTGPPMALGVMKIYDRLLTLECEIKELAKGCVFK